MVNSIAAGSPALAATVGPDRFTKIGGRQRACATRELQPSALALPNHRGSTAIKPACAYLALDPGFLHRLKSQKRLDVATSPQDLADTAPRRPAAGGGGIERSFNHAVFCKGALPVTDSPSFRIVG